MLRKRMEVAESQRDAWSDVASCHGCDSPSALEGKLVAMNCDLSAAHHDRDEFRRVVEALRDELAATEQKRVETTSELTRSMKDLDEIHQLLAPFSGDIDPVDVTEVELATMAARRLQRAEEVAPADVRKQLANQRDNAQALADKLQHLLDSKTHECEALRAEVARLSESVVGTIGSTDAVDVLDAAKGFLLFVPKRKLRSIAKPEKAREAAIAAVRNGAPRAEVLALVSVGTARRGAEWADAK